ncbi:hypothetical protein MA16_Dca009744 [Dendrobium catenatum]|uniref:Uncharacterized protein n=1 Tax=Dendrobium catenatum TaxID=906689 RepID=A0A2I0VQL7_9ASPA|nr:hypothetical protein MA16_Dca009744 [Dendrobium catenatum]
MKCTAKTNGLTLQPGFQGWAIKGGKQDNNQNSKAAKYQISPTKKEEPPRLPTKP